MITVSYTTYESNNIPTVLEACRNVRAYQRELLASASFNFLDFALVSHMLNRLAARAAELVSQLPEGEERTRLAYDIKQY